MEASLFKIGLRGCLQETHSDRADMSGVGDDDDIIADVTECPTCLTMTEHEIQMTCFGYDRNRTWKSNKKYADMLRRGLSKGIIARIKTYTGNQSRFMYYVPK